MKTFPESSFFKEKRAPELPPPSQVRAINHASGNTRANNFCRPPPVIVPSQGLVVKYGADVTIAEAETQVMVREQLLGRVPVPEVFGWTEDGDQTFIYMSLIPGETLQQRWGGLDENERQTICAELRQMVTTWKALRPELHDIYIGGFANQPLNDIFLANSPCFQGPCRGADAVRKFQEACGIDIDGKTAAVFTHADLAPPNIILSGGPRPRVMAVIDWGQAGWYPTYWEYCKARRVRADPDMFDDAMQEEWWTKYLLAILDPVHDTTYYSWLQFVLSKGI